MMCGIVGALATNSEWNDITQANFNRALERITPRGPDEKGELHLHPLHLGHRRLSIIDLSSTGKQPMVCPEKRWAIIFNGEIYNYIELRNKLTNLNHQFQGGSDTEVLLHWWSEFGVDGLSALNGYFAFAIYDLWKKDLFLVRDRLGIKPLYYSINNQGVYFGSDVQSVKAFLPQGQYPDLNALRFYFTLGYIPGEYSYDTRIKQVPCGNILKVTPQGNQMIPFWRLDPQASFASDNGPSLQQYSEELHQLLSEAIELQLRSDVPVGSFLSGGIDSSLVSAMAFQKNSSLKTYSIGFTENEYFDETIYAKMVSDKYGIDHTIIKVGNSDLLNALSGVLQALDQPFADSSAIPTFILCQQVSQSIKVALSGDGADEIFAGYNKYLGHFWGEKLSLIQPFSKLASHCFNSLPEKRSNYFLDQMRKFKKFFSSLSMSERDRYIYLSTYVSNSKLFSCSFLESTSDDYNHFWAKTLSTKNKSEVQSALLRDTELVLPYDMLVKVDRMSMAHGLEVRVPLLDHRIVEFAHSLPTKYKINSSHKKIILKEIAKKYLPLEVLNRPKQGFSIPLVEWMSSSLNPLFKKSIEKILDENDSSIFDLNYLNKLRLFEKEDWDQPTATLGWSLICYSYFLK